MPIFTDRDQFIRSAGLAGTDQVYAVVINREGNMLARARGRAGGESDAAKAISLQETLRQPGR